MIYLHFELPIPPSTNAIWRNVKGRTLLSSEARAYRKEVGTNLLLQRVPLRSLTGRLACVLEYWPGNARPCDLDNRIKAVLDALQHHKVIANDDTIDFLSIRRREILKPAGKLVVLLMELREHEAEVQKWVDANGPFARLGAPLRTDTH